MEGRSGVQFRHLRGQRSMSLITDAADLGSEGHGPGNGSQGHTNGRKLRKRSFVFSEIGTKGPTDQFGLELPEPNSRRQATECCSSWKYPSLSLGQLIFIPCSSEEVQG